MAIAESLTIVGGITGVVASFYGFVMWMRTTQRSQVEKERQLAHALRNYENLSAALAQLIEAVDENRIELLQIKTLMNVHFAPPGENTAGRRRRP